MENWVPTLEDYDKTIIEKLKEIKVDINGDGVLVPITVTAFSPEHETMKDVKFSRPGIAVNMYDQIHDLNREQSIILQAISSTPTDITLRGIPTPVKFFYQILIVTDYQVHMNEIIRQLNFLFPIRGYLLVTSPTGEEVDYDFFQKGVSNGFQQQYSEFGATADERVFRKVYRYHLFAEVEESPEHTYKKVQEREISVDNTNP